MMTIQDPFNRSLTKRRGWETILLMTAVALSIMVYAGALIYANIRALDLVKQVFPPQTVVVGQLALLALGLSMLAMPLALKWWFQAEDQRIVALVLYALEAVIVILNALLDTWITIGGVATLPTPLSFYLLYLFPATPVLLAAGWVIVWNLDPTSRESRKLRMLQGAARMQLSERLFDQLNATDIRGALQAAAEATARKQIANIVGVDHRDLFPSSTSVLPLPSPSEPVQKPEEPLVVPAAIDVEVLVKSMLDDARKQDTALIDQLHQRIVELEQGKPVERLDAPETAEPIPARSTDGATPRPL